MNIKNVLFLEWMLCCDVGCEKKNVDNKKKKKECSVSYRYILSVRYILLIAPYRHTNTLIGLYVKYYKYYVACVFFWHTILQMQKSNKQ